MSDMYAESRDWQEKAKVKNFMDERNVKKENAYNWIEAKTRLMPFGG